VIDKSFGFLPDTEQTMDTRDYIFSSSMPVCPEPVDLGVFLKKVFDQGKTESCVACAISAGRIILGIEKLPSVRFLYFNSRFLHDATERDSGTYIRLAFKAAARWGFATDEVCPFSVEKINKHPGFASFWCAFDSRKLEYHKMFSSGGLRENQIQQALSLGYPVVFGVGVGAEFTKDTGPTIVNDFEKGGVVGRHAMLIVGYNQTHFKVLNSWGSRWRKNGFCWVPYSALDVESARDFTVMGRA